MDRAWRCWARAMSNCGRRSTGWSRGSSLEAVVDEDATERLGKALAELRRAKDSVELDRMTRAVDAAVYGHLAAQRLARHGLTERALQIEMEAEFFRRGGARTAYGSIVGSGPNSAILHGTPGERLMSARGAGADRRGRGD